MKTLAITFVIASFFSGLYVWLLVHFTSLGEIFY
jgi:hypothetical protein